MLYEYVISRKYLVCRTLFYLTVSNDIGTVGIPFILPLSCSFCSYPGRSPERSSRSSYESDRPRSYESSSYRAPTGGSLPPPPHPTSQAPSHSYDSHRGDDRSSSSSQRYDDRYSSAPQAPVSYAPTSAPTSYDRPAYEERRPAEHHEYDRRPTDREHEYERRAPAPAAEQDYDYDRRTTHARYDERAPPTSVPHQSGAAYGAYDDRRGAPAPQYDNPPPSSNAPRYDERYTSAAPPSSAGYPSTSSSSRRGGDERDRSREREHPSTRETGRSREREYTSSTSEQRGGRSRERERTLPQQRPAAYAPYTAYQQPAAAPVAPSGSYESAPYTAPARDRSRSPRERRQ
jgi:hypothetical protein